MSGPWEPADHQPATDIVGGSVEPPRRHGKGRTIAIAAAALLTAGVVGGGVYAATALSGGGAQPEDVLPSGAIGFLKIDLDPSAGQKIAVYNLAKKFPDSGVRGQDSVKDDLLRALLEGEDEAEYDAQVRPWLGERAGIAFLAPTAEQPEEPVVVAAVQFTDRAKAQDGLASLAADEEGDELHYAFSDDEDYVLLSDDQAAVDNAAGQQEHLSDNPGFEKAVDALEGDQIALGWMDIGALWKAVPEEQRAEAFSGGYQLDPSGLAVVGAHVADGTVEVVGKTLDLSAGPSPEAQKLLSNPIGRAEPSGLLQGMPEDSIGAFSVTGLGDGLTELYDTLVADIEDDEDFQAGLDSLGLTLPDDLGALFGSEAAMFVAGDLAGGEPTVGVRVNTSDADRAVEILGRAVELAAEQTPDEAAKIDVRKVDGGYAAGYGPDATATDGTLGDSPVFQRTLPDVDSSGLTYYIDIRRVMEQVDAYTAESDGGLTDTQRSNIEPLRAVGYTAALDEGNATFRLRLTVEE